MRNFVLLILSTLLSLNSAWAEEAPFIYGRLVSGLDWTNHLGDASSRRWRSANSQWGTSLWGMQGETTIGAGVRALFRFESGFDLNEGRADGFFNRIARVGLQSNHLGAIYAGRDMKLSDSEVWALDPGGFQFLGAATLLRGRVWGSRANALSYRSPDWAGWTAAMQFASAGHAGDFARGREWSVNVKYARGPLLLTMLYDAVRNGAPTGDAYGDLYRDSKQYTIGGTYLWKKTTFFAAYTGLRAERGIVGPDNPKGADRNDAAWLGVRYQATPALDLLGALYHARLNRGGGSATLFVLGANYALSKRTSLYASLGSVFNHGHANFAAEAGGPASDNPAPGATQQGAYAGVVHRF